MEMLTNEKMQVARERAENEKLVKMNNSLKENFVRANRCFNNMKIRYTDVDKTNAALRNHGRYIYYSILLTTDFFSYKTTERVQRSSFSVASRSP